MARKEVIKEMQIKCEKTSKLLANLEIKYTLSRRNDWVIDKKDYDKKMQELLNKKIMGRWTYRSPEFPEGKVEMIACPEVIESLWDKLNNSETSHEKFFFDHVKKIGVIFK